MQQPTDPSRQQTTPKTQKRAYHSPRLIEYGDVARLTTSGSGPGFEGMSGKAGMN